MTTLVRPVRRRGAALALVRLLPGLAVRPAALAGLVASTRPVARVALLLAALAGVLATAAPSPATASEPAAGGDPDAPPALPDPRWTVDDALAGERAEGWTVSRDGRLAAWVKVTLETEDGEEKEAANLQLCRLDAAATAEGDGYAPTGARRRNDRACRPLTRGPGRRTDPAFSPDGAHLAYRSADPPPGGGDDGENAGDDEPTAQVWLLPLAGGAPWPVTRFDRPVAAFAWIDARSLAVLAAESPTAWEREREEWGDTSVVVEDAEREPPVRLFRVDLDGEVRRVTDNRLWLDGLAVSPDGKWAVVAERLSLSFEFDARVPPRLDLVELATGERTLILEGERLLPYGVQWAPDSAGFYFVDPRSNHPLYREAAIAELWFYDLAARAPERLPLDPRGLGGAYAPAPGGVIALEAGGVRLTPVRIARAAGGGWERRPLAAEHAGQIQSWELDAGGAVVVYERSTAALPPQWYAARLDGDSIAAPRRLTGLNPSWRGKPTGRVEVVRWTGALGEEVEGLLHYPLDWPAERPAGEAGDAPARRPLILHVHGGPAGADRDAWGMSWHDPLLLWRQRGAFVLQANYHGSSDYGLDWVTSIEKRYYELEVPDLEAGVDFAIARGLADPERLATVGWSNGGILSAALITESRRWRAASIGAADVEWFSDWGNVDFGAAFDNYYFGGPPWEIPEVYRAKSPFFELPEVTTPTIVFTGTEDRAVPPSQSWSLYRALQQVDKAPVRLVLFPGEPHSLGKPAHRRRKVEEELAWFERWLWGGGDGGDGGGRPEAVPADSPLAALLARARAARAGATLGVEAGGVLTPETVPFRGLLVGRFEVTRAQWAAFDPAAAPAPGEEDLPATGMPFERARAYAAWLAEKTGRPFRLPTAAEAAALAAAAEDGDGEGNTLARWAGKAPNPEDRAAIAAALAEAAGRLGRAAPLLLPVGSLPGVGEDPLFDLDGNAAEWAVGEDGAGVPAGPSADRADDPRGGSPGEFETPGPAYVGLRVVADG